MGQVHNRIWGFGLIVDWWIAKSECNCHCICVHDKSLMKTYMNWNNRRLHHIRQFSKQTEFLLLESANNVIYIFSKRNFVFCKWKCWKESVVIWKEVSISFETRFKIFIYIIIQRTVVAKRTKIIQNIHVATFTKTQSRNKHIWNAHRDCKYFAFHKISRKLINIHHIWNILCLQNSGFKFHDLPMYLQQ